MPQDRIRIAIAGNPNSGKTTIFNALTGTRQRVGNYPGVTVEKKEGTFFHNNRFRIHAVDLPGTYSLAASSMDEKIARDYIVAEKPDVVVDVLDASNFERNAYLTAQLAELGVRLVLVLNMSDRARANGQVLDLDMIRERLGCEVVETVGSKGRGISELKDAIVRAAVRDVRRLELDYGEEFGGLVDEIKERLLALDAGLSPHESRWLSAKLFEGDGEIARQLAEKYGEGAAPVIRMAGEMRKSVEGHHGDTLATLMAEHRYGFAAGLYREVVRQEPRDRQRFSDNIDDILTHRIVGIPLFLLLMYVVFYATFRIGEMPMGWIETSIGWLGSFVSMHWPGDGALKSLMVDGVVAGVGGVLVFLPNIAFLFMFIAILEDTGYMARVAFIMDRLMHKMGLHGKSFIPLMIGFGCSVPAIMATRTLEHRRDRLTTMLVVPLISCGARFPIYALIIPAFFPEEWRAPMLWLIYMIGIALAVLIARLLRSFVFKGDSAPFVMELPPYRMPTLRGIIIHMWERAKLYLKKAGTIILGISILLWAMTSYPRPPASMLAGLPSEQARQVKISYSVAGRIGHAIEPLLKPMGFDWKIGTALIGALAAKEAFVAQMGIVYAVGEADEESKALRDNLKANYSMLAAFCVMLFCLISAPCMATIAVTRRESNSWRLAILQLSGLTALAYVLTTIVYQVGSILGIGSM